MMKKLLALILTLVLVMGMTTTAFASEMEKEGSSSSELGTKLTILEGSNSTYTGDRDYVGYQILTASVSGSNYAYQINETYKAVLIDVLGLGATATDEQIIAGIRAKETAEARRTFSGDLYRAIKKLEPPIAADVTWTVEGDAEDKSITIEQGYWLIADVTDMSNSEYTNSLVMIDTVGDTEVTIHNKPDVPTGKKEIDDEEDSIVAPEDDNEDATSWQESADYDIGDLVPYHISGMLPNNVTAYRYYMFLINDTLSEGLTYAPDTFAITVNGEEKSIKSHGTEGADFWYTITEDETTKVQSLAVYPAHGYTTNANDPKAANATNGGDFKQLFAAETDKSSINSSTYNFTYSCMLNDKAVIGGNGNPNTFKLIFSNNPYGDTFGETTPDTVIVLTYKTVFNKVDGQGKELEGADFDVYKFVAVKDVTDKQKEDAVELVALTTVEQTMDAAANKTLIHHPGANCYGYFEIISRKTTNAVEETEETEAKGATEFTFSGMDAGYYRLVESVTPAGYNGIDPVDFHIIADHDKAIIAGNDVLNSLTALTRVSGEMNLEGNTLTGTLTAAVQNQSGNELPSTGGIGTTIFYVIGGILVVGAAVILVTKRRMAE